uniref:non-specific serine/threonine protein kinase n=1 Tax=Solanum tuberosum TaxID=4113 RepID=M1BZN2_SOLTU
MENLYQIILGKNQLTGELPSCFGNLSSLRELYLDSNALMSHIPSTFWRNRDISILTLSSNLLNGSLAVEMGNSRGSRILHLHGNQFSGQIPSTIGQLQSLVSLSLSKNMLDGSIPELFEDLVSLEHLDLSSNNLSGMIPKSLRNLEHLMYFNVSFNGLMGEIPDGGPFINFTAESFMGNPALCGSSRFHVMQCRVTSLERKRKSRVITSVLASVSSGVVVTTIFIIWFLKCRKRSTELPLVDTFGQVHKRISYYDISQGTNNFDEANLIGRGSLGLVYKGTLADGMVVAIKVFNTELQHAFRSFEVECQVLRSIRHRNLVKVISSCANFDYKVLVLEYMPNENLECWLHSTDKFLDITQRLKVMIDVASAVEYLHGGKIPTNISNFRNLEWLTLGDNKLIGSIPPDLGNLRNLKRFSLEKNNLDGIIPTSLCKMESLYQVILGKNQLSGELPSCFGNISSLRELYLDSNALISHIPSTFWRNRDISILTLSSNLLNGSLAVEMGNSRGSRILHLHGNQFSGQIPSTIGQLQSLVSLSLSKNMLDGSIPELFEDLVSLEYLDLSSNNLTGMIPKSLRNLEHLMYFNVSFNGLMGEIPDGGPFVNFTAESFMGNPALCGSSRFHVMQCRVTSLESKRKSRVLTSVLASVSSGVVVTTIFIIWFLKCRKRSTELPLVDTFGQVHKRISYYDISQGTNNFDEANLIGRGSLGLVYKGTLADGMVVAIKVFNTELQHAFRSFEVECQVLRSIRHRNLVKVISSCANFDYKVLVLEYMPNENLECWLHSTDKFLDITQRLKVMIDVASAVEYLHGGHLFVVIHCDLKPSNILLDGDMVAKVSDFGISKLLTAETLIAHTKTLGTIGYMAPEYGSEGKVSTKGDVYSFGILLMETFTRKSPVDDLFVGDFTLKRWICQSLPDRLVDVVDINLFSLDEENFTSKERCFKSIMELALECTNDFPEERICMEDITLRLKKILTQFLQNVVTN